MENQKNTGGGLAILMMVAVVVAVVAGLMYAIPKYGVWTNSLSGEGELKKAEYTRRIAELDAAAEVARANGVAQANKIVAEGLGGPEGYLRYLWIEKVAGSRNQVIYVPTQGGLPVLESARLMKTGEAQ